MKPFVLLLTPSTKKHTFSFLFLLAACLGAPSALAATYYWDTNDSTAGFGTAGGTWAEPTTNNSTQGWSTSSAGTNVMSGTTNTTTSDALNFGTGSAGLATGTITVSGNVSSAGITFGNASGNITLTGGTITLNGLLYRLGSAATTQTINSDIVLVGARQFGANQQNEKLVFGGNISGSGASLTMDTNASGGLITLNGSNSFSGNLSIVRGQLNVNSVSDKLVNSALGAGSKIIAGAAGGQGPVLNYTANTSGSTDRDLELNVSGGGSLTITSQNAALTLSGTAINTVANGNGILNLSGDAGGGSNINHFSGAIQDNGNSTISVQLLAVTPTGSSLEHGFWKISGNNTYSGTTTVTNASTLILGHSNALGATANGTSVAASAQLLLADGISVGAEALVLNSSAGSSWNGQTGAALRSYTGNNSWAGNITISQATTIATNSGSNLTISGGITGTNQNLTSNSVGNTILSGNITTGTGTLTKNGTGSLTLSGTNTFTGTTTINNNSGTLVIGGSGLLGGGSYSGNVSIGTNSFFQYGSTANQTLSGVLSGAGQLNYYSTGTLTLSGSNSMSGTLAMGYNSSTDMGKIVLLNSNALGTKTVNFNDVATIELGVSGLMIANNITANNQGGSNTRYVRLDLAGTATGTLSGTMDSRGKLITFDVGTDDTLTLSGAVTNSTGTNPFAKSGSGTLLLTGNSTYGGATTISAGTWEMGAAGRLGGGSYAGAISNSGTFIYSGTNAQTLSGVISGIGALTQNGTGTLTLSGANTYTGATTINAGTLSIASISNSGVAGALGNSTNAAGNLVLGGGSLLYTGSNSSTDRNFTLTASTTSEIHVSNAATTLTISGTSASTNGALTKNGSGTLVLSGNNAHSGATTINAGTLVLSGTNTGSAVTINSGGSLLSATSIGSTTVNSGGKIAPGASANSVGSLTVAGLTLNSSGTYTWDMSNATGAAGTGWDRIASSGLLTIGATSGSKFTIAITSSGVPTNWDYTNSGQTWDIITYGSLSGFSADKFAFDTSAFGGSVTPDSSWALSDTGSALRLTYTYTASTPTWAGTNGNWSTGFSPAITTGANATFLGAGGVATNNIASGSLTSVGSITFSGNGAYTLQANSGSSGFDAASALQLNGNIINNSAATQTINLALTSNSTRVYDAAVGNITIGNAIIGTGGLTKNGTGTLTLAGNSTYSGATTINSGTLKAGSTTGLSSGSAVSVAAGATLDLGGFNNTISSLSTATGTITDSSSAGNGGTLRIATAMPSATSAQLFTGSMGLQLYGGSTVSGILTNTASTYSGGTTFGNGSGTTSTRLLVSGTIGSGSGGAVTNGIYGTGAITLGAATTDRVQFYFAGATTINNNIVVNSSSGNSPSEVGAFRAESAGNVIAGSINANLADAMFTANNAGGRSISVTGQIYGNSGITVTTLGAGGLEVTLNNAGTANSYAGNTTISTTNATLTLGRADQIANGAAKGNLIINSGTFKMGGFSDTINGLLGNGTVDGVSGTPTLTIGDNDATSTFSGVIKNTAGTLALTKIGTGTLTLSGNNTYSGGTTINTGTFVIGHANAAGSGTITQANGSSLLKFDTTGTIANAMSIHNVSANETVTLSGGITVNNATFDVASGETLTISNTINGTGGVTKNGTGTLVLSGSNTYSGATIINSGTLEAADTGALGSNNTVQVNGGSLLVSANGSLEGKNIGMGGSGIGLQFSGNYSGVIGNLTLSADSIIDLGPGSVQILFQGLALSNHTLSFYNWTGTTLWNGGTGADQDKVYFGPDLSDEALAKIYFYTGPGDSFLGSGFDLGLKPTGFDAPWNEGYQIIPVPEPETYGTGLLLLLGGAVWMWKRNRKSEACSHCSPLPCWGEGK